MAPNIPADNLFGKLLGVFTPNVTKDIVSCVGDESAETRTSLMAHSDSRYQPRTRFVGLHFYTECRSIR
jgi:hypothetical protein